MPYLAYEVFHRSPACEQHGGWEKDASGSCHECAMLSGFYWWSCLPDSDPVGPFASEDEADQDTQDVDLDGSSMEVQS